MFPIKYLGVFIVLFIASEFGARAQSEKFQIPEITVEAYLPSGFSLSLPAKSGIRLVGFHININREIDPTENGQFSQDIVVKDDSDDVIRYYNPTYVLKKGDVIYYWLHVQHDILRYKKENQKFTITEFLPKCKTAKTITVDENAQLCVDTKILAEEFDKSVFSDSRWILEQYIPDSPDYEFVQYKKDDDVTFIKDNLLCIKPKLIKNTTALYQPTLDLSEGCTKKIQKLCKKNLYDIHNPIVSGRLVSKLKFTYGKVEIKARLPSGDWIYPEIYLEDDTQAKLYIAYARGNEQLTGNDGVDIGGRLLFGGPSLHPREPKRSEKLSSIRKDVPFSNAFHTYKLVWTPDKIKLFVDNEKYGEIDTRSIESSSFGSRPNKAQLVIGVGVGGITDFPDGFKSGKFNKPWVNGQRRQLVLFWENKPEWYDASWTDGSRLLVDYVHITTI